jgi:hypothetical protein
VQSISQIYHTDDINQMYPHTLCARVTSIILRTEKLVRSGTVNFVLGFMIIIKSVNLGSRGLLKYESRYKINGSRTLQTNFSVRRATNLPRSHTLFT